MKDQIDVQKVASLAKLSLSNEQEKTYGEQLSQILLHMETLQEVDTSEATPTAQVNGLQNVLREDMVAESLPQAVVVSLFPESREAYCKINAVFQE